MPRHDELLLPVVCVCWEGGGVIGFVWSAGGRRGVGCELLAHGGAGDAAGPLDGVAADWARLPLIIGRCG